MTNANTPTTPGGAWLTVPTELLDASRAALANWAEAVRVAEPWPWVAMGRWERDAEHGLQPDDAELDRDESTAVLRWQRDADKELVSPTYGPVGSLAVATGFSPVPLQVPRPTSWSARTVQGGGALLTFVDADAVHLTSVDPSAAPLLADTVVLSRALRSVDRDSAARVRCLVGPGVAETPPDVLARFVALEQLDGAVASDALLRVVRELPQLRALGLWADVGHSAALTTVRLPRLARVRLRGFEIAQVGEFLRAHTGLEALDVRTNERPFALRDLDAPKGLRELRLTGCRGFVALDDADVVRPLERLHVAGCVDLADLDVLREARRLRQLDISACLRLPDTRPLAELGQLEVLYADVCPRIGAPDRLVLPPNLVQLVVGTASRLVDARPLASLTRLRSLRLEHCARLRSLASLEACAATLERLVLDDCFALEDLSALAQHRALRELSLRRCSSLRDLTPLAGLTALRVDGPPSRA